MIRTLLLNRENWEKTALIDGEKSLTYGELAGRAFALRTLLPESAGAHAAILLHDGADFIAALFGALMAGMTVMPLSASLTSYEVDSLLGQTSTRILISSKSFLPLLSEIEDTPEIIYMEELPAPPGEPPQAVYVDTDAPMLLLATSGTTGRAKIVVLSERNLGSCVLDYYGKMNFDIFAREQVRNILCTPFCSAYALFIISAIMRGGNTIVVPPFPFTLDSFYKAVDRYRITHYEGGAAAILLMERGIGREIPYDIRSLRYLGFGGSGVSGNALRRLVEEYPWMEFWQGYGLTEASPLVTKAYNSFPKEKLDSVGVAAKNMELRIEADGEKTQIPFVRGEIVVKAPSVMLGYYENEAETARVIRDGWLYTGDIGYLDEEGWLYLCGRVRNIILVRGFTVHPEEVETCILSSSLAADCVVYGESDDFGGECVCADVVPKSADVTADDIMIWCRDHLSAYKQPLRVRLTDAISKTSTGKTARTSGEGG
jgi:long-chain acyl-CoA synthetase